MAWVKFDAEFGWVPLTDQELAEFAELVRETEGEVAE